MLTLFVILAVAANCLAVEKLTGCIGTCPEAKESGIFNYLPHIDRDKYCVCVYGRPVVIKSLTQPFVRPPSHSPTRPPSHSPTRPPASPPGMNSAGCIGTCPLCNSPDHTDQLPHQDPTKFCKCNWGTPVVFQCPGNLVYDSINEVCGYSWGTGCPNSKSKVQPQNNN